MSDELKTQLLDLDGVAESEGNEPAWVDDILRFWFQELSESQWWQQDDAVDARIRERFGALHEHLSAQANNVFTASRALLATIIVLDQFSRHIFRHTPLAYAADPMARRIARFALEQRLDSGLSVAERLFLYLPFQHSEDAADQQLSVQLFESIGKQEWIQDAVEHRQIIDRYGRFPHRNAVLGRESTPDEIEALRARGTWF